MDGVPASVNTSAIQDIFAGGGEMGKLMRSLDWSQTPLGPIEQWPQSLRTAISICLMSRFPMLIWWGPELVMLYNDAYRPILGASKHPQAMGQRGRECWPEIWDIIGPMLEGVLTRGEATWSDNQMLPLDRNGYVEECYFTFSYSPIRDETGGIGGVFTAVTETTGQILSERRLHTLHELAERTAEAQNAEEVCFIAAETLAENTADIPFALLYLLQHEGTQAVQVGMFGLTSSTECCPYMVDIQAENCPDAWAMAQVIGTGEPAFISPLPQQLDFIPIEMSNIQPHSALILPMSRAGQSIPYGLLIAGISPLRDLDSDYRNFFGLVAEQIANAIAKVRTYQETKERAEALAELDRAKTTFFSNISHEFRTPLTLLLGPIEDMLADSKQPLPEDHYARLEIVRRNGLRLLKLVNTLLDFSRIEAGRLQAVYEPTDLALFTTELASVFRAAVERAGLELVIDCPPVVEPVYIDRDMWEKIVLNLLSNAFKFTFSGQIAVTMRSTGTTVELLVSDTGIGIAEDELSHIFERFHQVKNVRTRTYEGSGIGLALVNELVHYHGGSVSVESLVGKGTTFTVSVPLGLAHLPLDRVRETAQASLTPIIQHASPYIEEAARWIPSEVNEHNNDEASTATQPAVVLAKTNDPVQLTADSILLADDNADMRDYVKRLLSQYWTVEAVGDGRAALAAIQRQKPDIVLSDVMMPGLDGFQLLAALRNNPETSSIPVIMLSARAGEEAAIEGLEAGADDYLIKPFSARELVARVGTHLKIAHMRQQTVLQEQAHAGRLQKLAQASLVIMSRTSLEERLLLITDQARAVIGAHQAITTRTINQVKRQNVNAVSLSEKYAQWRDYDTQPDGSGIYSVVCESNTPIRLTQEELEQHPAWRNFGKEVEHHPPMRGWLAAPLIGRNGQNLGVLQLSDKYEGEFTEEDEAILTQFAQIASVAIENAELYSAAQEAIRGRDEMLSLVTHDLKNPVSTIKGYAQLLKRQVLKVSELDRQQLADGLTRIDTTSTKMVTLINELLTMTRLQIGLSVELEREPTDLVELVYKTVAAYQQTTEKHTLRFETADLEVTGEWDASQLERVLGNLLSNAIKYSPHGGDVIVRVGIEADRDGHGVAVLAVRDSGIGIPEADISHIFEQFHRAGNATGQFSGTGIGLASAHSIIEQHGGTLTVESKEGKGSVFTVRLPLEKA